MPDWIKDEHGQIKIPTPDYSLGTGRRAGLGLGGAALSAQAHGPQQISGLGIGLGPVAGAADQWAGVLAKMEEQKQKIEVLDWTQAYQDRERDRLAQMAELKGKDGVDQAAAFMKEFYDAEDPKLLGMARGEFQKNYLKSFLAHSRAAGLNRAYAHQIREFETYQGQVWEGETAGTLARIEADPENHEIYLAGLNRLDADMNPGDAPAFRAAKARQRRDQGLETAIMALGRAGKYDEAERLLMETFGVTETAGGYGLSKGQALWGKIQDMRLEQEKKAADQAVAVQYQGLKDQVSGLPFDEWNATFRNLAADIPDHGLREYYLKLWAQDLSAEKERRAANDQAAFGRFMEEADAQGWTASQKIAGLESIREKMTPEGWAARRKQLAEGSINKETLENIKAKNELLRRIDLRPGQKGAINSEKQIDAFAEEHKLTLEQWKDGKEYLDQGGKGGHTKFSAVESLYKKLADTSKDLPEGFYEAVLELVPDGKKIGDQELRGIVANLIMKGEVKQDRDSWVRGFGYGPDRTYFEALKKGQAAGWLPDVPPDKEKAIREELKANGKNPTDEEIRKVYAELKGIKY